MRTTTTKTEFKQWQVLPALSRPPGQAAVATALPGSRAAASTESSLAEPGRAEPTGRSSQAGELQSAGNPPENSSTPRVAQRP